MTIAAYTVGFGVVEGKGVGFVLRNGAAERESCILDARLDAREHVGGKGLRLEKQPGKLADVDVNRIFARIDGEIGRVAGGKLGWVAVAIVRVGVRRRRGVGGEGVGFLENHVDDWCIN